MITPHAYAAALARILGNTDALRTHATALARIAELLNADVAIVIFLERGDIGIAERLAVLRTAFGVRVPEAAYAAIALLANRHALASLSAVVDALDARADAASGIARVTIESAYALPASVHREIEHAITAAIGRTVRATYAESPQLIAGLRITVDGSRQWDGSIAGKLAQITERLCTADAYAQY